nr:hypothetical protein [Brevundimonas diminuta]
MTAGRLPPFTLPLRREGDAATVDKNGKTVLVIDPDRDLEDDEATRIADHVFNYLSAGGAVWNEAIEAAAKAVERQIPPPAGGPFSHTNTARVVMFDAVKAIRALATEVKRCCDRTTIGPWCDACREAPAEAREDDIRGLIGEAIQGLERAIASTRFDRASKEVFAACVDDFRKVLRAQPQAREEGDYDLGKRDGYERAVQDIDLLTGGDGEYVFSTDGGGCLDAESMKARIAERFQAREDAQPFMWAYQTVTEGEWRAFSKQLERADGSICPGVALFTHPAPDALRIALEALPGATYQKSETITLTASGDETCAELKQHMASVLPQEFQFAGGLDRIRKGDPVLGADRLHERDQQAHAAFVAHHPRQALAALQAEQGAK